MMRVLLLVLFFSVPASALELRAGVDGGLFFRGEAGGNRTVLPTLAPRLSVAGPRGLSGVVQWPIAYSPAGNGLGSVSTLHHRLVLRAEYALPVRAASFYAGAGAGLVFMHSRLWDGDEAPVSVTTVRAGPAFAAGLDVALTRWTLRCGVETVFAAGRRDLSVLVGATLPLGGGR